MNYLDGQGNWRPIDTSLVASERLGFAWENKAAAYTVLLPAHPGREPIRFEYDEAWVTFMLRDALAGRTPVVRDGAAKVSVMSGVTAEWSPTATGLKEEIVLTGPQSPRQFTFDLVLSPGLMANIVDGAIVFADNEGVPAFSFTPPYMMDSSGKEEGLSNNVSYELKQSTGGYELVLTADAKWLAQPERVWPVTIDPTVTLPPINTPSDCHIASGSYADNGHCGYTVLKTGYYNPDGEKRRALLKFDLSGEILERDITSASVFLWCEGGTTSNSADILLRRVSHSWVHATWNRWESAAAPTGGPWGTAGGDFSTTDYGTRNTNCSTTGWKEWTAGSSGVSTVAGLVNGWIDGTFSNYGVLLKQAPGETTNNLLSFTSLEGTGHEPYLSASFTNTTPSVPETFEPEGPAWDLDTTPTLAAEFVDADTGDHGRAKFRVCSTSSCSGSVVASGDGTLVASGNTSSWTSATALTLGNTYYWQAQNDDGVASSGWSDSQEYQVELVPPELASPLSSTITGLDAASLFFDFDDGLWIQGQVASSALFGGGSIVCDTGWLESESSPGYLWDLDSCSLDEDVEYWWRGRVADGDPAGSPTPHISDWTDPSMFDTGDPPEDPVLLDLAADYYAGEFGVTYAQALARVEAQEVAHRAEADIIEAAGTDYFGGIWSDPSVDGNLKIGVSAPGDVEAVEDVLDLYGLATTTDIVTVGSSVDELEQAEEAMVDAVVEESGARPATITANVQTNAVEIEVSDELAPASLSALEELASEQAADVGIEQIDEDAVAQEDFAFPCKLWPRCTRPLRGGVGIYKTGTNKICTAGFMVRETATADLGVLTAGHCMAGTNSAWHAKTNKGVVKHIGLPEVFLNNGWDAARIDVASGSYWHGRARGFVLLAPRESLPQMFAEYKIKGTRIPFYGDVVCVTSLPPLENGRHSGCGTVKNPDYHDIWLGHFFTHLGMVHMCNETVGGSSGGPWFVNHKAIGVNKGKAGDCELVYQLVEPALEQTGSTLIVE